MNFKKIMFGLSMISALGFASVTLAKNKNDNGNMKNNSAMMIEITPEDVKAVKITDVDGNLEMKGFSIDRKEIKPGMARLALEKLKDKIEPGETVVLDLGIMANGKAEACKLKLTMGDKKEVSSVDIEGCDTFKSAKLKGKGKKVVIVLRKAENNNENNNNNR